MPVIKASIKSVRQTKVRTARNRHYESRMKSMIKLFLGYIRKNEYEKANKILSDVVSSIDTCAKKNLIHKNNAARKKSRLQRALSGLQKGGAEKAPKAPKAPKKEKKAE